MHTVKVDSLINAVIEGRAAMNIPFFHLQIPDLCTNHLLDFFHTVFCNMTHMEKHQKSGEGQNIPFSKSHFFNLNYNCSDVLDFKTS